MTKYGIYRLLDPETLEMAWGISMKPHGQDKFTGLLYTKTGRAELYTNEYQARDKLNIYVQQEKLNRTMNNYLDEWGEHPFPIPIDDLERCARDIGPNEPDEDCTNK